MKYLRKFNENPLHKTKKTQLDMENLYSDENEDLLNIAANNQKEYQQKYINELFLYFYRPYYAIFDKVKNYNEYEIENFTEKKFKVLVDDINRQLNFYSEDKKELIFIKQYLLYLLSFFFVFVGSLGLLTFILINSLISKKPNIEDLIIIERTPASSSKLNWLKINNKIETIREEVKLHNKFYSFIRFKDLPGVLHFLSVNIAKDLKFIYSYSKKYFGKYFTSYIVCYYSKRIPHTIMYEIGFNNLLKNSNCSKVFSGNNLDRFALIEEKACRAFNNELINIPHGIEYGFRLPHPFTGDLFYTLSRESADFLNSLYNMKKFVYQEDIVYKMLNKNHPKKETFCVFFTEPSEININKKIISELKRITTIKRIKFFIKLHPKDNKKNYEGLEVEFINDFNQSIANNICVARKSTILLEAIYNHSQPIAVLLNKSDKFIFKQFPSLHDSRISQVYSLDSLQDHF